MTESSPEHPHEKKGFQLTLPASIVAGAVLIACAIILTRGQTVTVAADAGSGSSISIRPPSLQDHIVGSPNAPVVIVEFADFECPYCAMIYPTIKNIVANSQGKVAWVYRNFPLDSIHPEARPAAEAAECIAGELGNDAFWKFVDQDFAHQSSIGSAFYASVAQSLGANPQTFANCVAQKKNDSRINADEAEAIAAGGQGTPFTVVIGKDGSKIPFSGALPADQITAIVQSVLSKQK